VLYGSAYEPLGCSSITSPFTSTISQDTSSEQQKSVSILTFTSISLSEQKLEGALLGTVDKVGIVEDGEELGVGVNHVSPIWTTA
jgi:hypothetical protein